MMRGYLLSALLFVLNIKPLGNLLRSHEGNGVCLSTNHTSTGTFLTLLDFFEKLGNKPPNTA